MVPTAEKVAILCFIILVSSILTENQTIMDNPYFGIVRTVEWSHDGSILAVSGDENLWLYNENFEEVAHFTDFEGRLSALSWSPNDTMIALILDLWHLSPDNHTDIVTLDSHTGETLMGTSATFFTTPIVWSPDNTSVALGDVSGTLHVYDALTGEEILSFSEEVEDNPHQPNAMTSLCWNATQNQIVTRHSLGLYILNASTGDEDNFFRIPSISAGPGACSPAGTLLVTTDGYRIELATGEYISAWLDNDRLDTFAISWHPDGSQIVTNGENHIVEIWDADTGEQLATLEGGGIQSERGFNEYNDSLAWSPDGNMFAEAGQDGIVRIWDAETYELINTLDFTE